MSGDAAGLIGAAGLALLSLSYGWKVWRRSRDWRQIVLYAVFGVIVLVGVISRLAVIA